VKIDCSDEERCAGVSPSSYTFEKSSLSVNISAVTTLIVALDII
jgi:hypothetical protein